VASVSIIPVNIIVVISGVLHGQYA
jgi:hypothetical protein